MTHRPSFARLAALLIAGAGLAVFGGAPAARADVHAVGVESATVPPGATVTLDVTADATAPGIGAYVVDVTYDSSLISVADCAAGPGAEVCNPTFKSNIVRLAGASPQGLTGHAVLGSLTVKAGDKDGIATLQITASELTDPDGNDLGFVAVNGTVTVKAGVSPTVLPAASAAPGATLSRTSAANTRNLMATLAQGGSGAAAQAAPPTQAPGDSGGSSTAAWLLAGLGLAVVAGGVWAVSRLRKRA